MISWIKALSIAAVLALSPMAAFAAISPLSFTVNMSEAVNVVTSGGTPRVAIDVGGVTRYASYSAGTGTSSLTFTYTPTLGDVDLDGISIPSGTIDLNGGTIKDLAGNDLTPLTFAVPNTSGVKVNYPSLSMDFVYDADGRYTLNGTAYDTLPAFLTATGGSFTRASIGTYYDSAGTLQTASSGTPRFDYDPVTHAAKGILIEEQRTNLIINGQGQGASGVSYPTGWNRDQPFGGIELSSMSSGTNSNGYGYLQFTVNGTTTIGNRLLLTPTTTRPNVTAGSPYTFSYGVQLMSGTYPYTIQPVFMWYDSGGTQIGTGSAAIRTPTTSWARYSDTVTPPANTTSVRIRYDFTGYGGPVGTVINFTMQISGTQLERGAFPTSYIPTTTAAVARSGDILSVNPSGWFNNSQGTWSAFFQGGKESNQGFYGRVISFNGSNTFLSTDSGITSTLGTWSGGGVLYKATGIDYWTTAGGAGMSYNATSLTRSITGRGQAVSTGAYVNSYTPAGSIGLGSNPGSSSNCLNGTISKAKYYPLRVSDTQLQLLTQ